MGFFIGCGPVINYQFIRISQGIRHMHIEISRITLFHIGGYPVE